MDGLREVSPGRRPGRPRQTEPHVRVSTWLPTRTADDLCRLALKHGMSVSAFLSTSVQLGLPALQKPGKQGSPPK